MNLVRSQTCSLANGVVINDFDVGKYKIRAVLMLVDGDRKNLKRCLVNTFGATIGR